MITEEILTDIYLAAGITKAKFSEFKACLLDAYKTYCSEEETRLLNKGRDIVTEQDEVMRSIIQSIADFKAVEVLSKRVDRIKPYVLDGLAKNPNDEDMLRRQQFVSAVETLSSSLEIRPHS